MKRVPILLACTALLFAGWTGTCTPDVESTVQAAVASTLTAQPTATRTPIRTLTRDVESTVQVAVAATLTAQPTATRTSMPTPTTTRTPTHTPTPKATPTRALPPPATASPFTISLETFKGEGFSFQYPANARLEEVVPNRRARGEVPIAASEIHVVGPNVWVKPGDAEGGWRGPAYELITRTYENPEGLDVETWARNYIVTSWQWARERGRPWGALPISEEGEIDEDAVGHRVVGGQPVFWVRYFAFDSVVFAYYLSINHQVVELSFRLYSLRNQPLAEVQQDVYALILGTFIAAIPMESN